MNTGIPLPAHYFGYILYNADFVYDKAERIPLGPERLRQMFRLGVPFITYNAKGSFDRPAQHIAAAIMAILRGDPVKEAPEEGFGPDCVSVKREMILLQKNIGIAILKDGMTNEEALVFEYHFIETLGTAHLANIRQGNKTKLGKIVNNSVAFVVSSLVDWTERMINNDLSVLHT